MHTVYLPILYPYILIEAGLAEQAAKLFPKSQ